MLTMSMPLSFSKDFKVNFNNCLEDKVFGFFFYFYSIIVKLLILRNSVDEIANNLFLIKTQMGLL